MRRMRILVVDDEPLNREMIQVILDGLGHEVLLARNGAEAVTQAEASRFDLVVMDILMPVMDGLEATRRIRQESPNREVPILALTARTREENQTLSLQAGVDHFVPKPVTRRQLIEAIDETLRRRGVTV